MKKQDALTYYGSIRAVAMAAKVTRAAVYQWGAIIPLVSAVRLQEASGGDLLVTLSDYPKGRAGEPGCAIPDSTPPATCPETLPGEYAV